MSLHHHIIHQDQDFIVVTIKPLLQIELIVNRYPNKLVGWIEGYYVKYICIILAGNSSPVSPHLQQNGFGSSTPTNVSANNNNQVAGSQPAASMGQSFTGAGGTWTGSNTLTYTQSMQPPDNRNHHTNYCKASL